MSGYRRFVAYVYEYEGRKKGNGKGFVKVEVRDGVCRMQFGFRVFMDRKLFRVKFMDM